MDSKPGCTCKGVDAQRQLLEYLMGVADRTGGAEVWRALFAEMREGLEGK